MLLTLDEKDPKRLFEGSALLKRLTTYGLLDDQKQKVSPWCISYLAVARANVVVRESSLPPPRLPSLSGMPLGFFRVLGWSETAEFLLA